jgi:tetratricopeptide (TPR) repeat protein
MNSPIEGEDVNRPKRQGAEQAIELALESKWEEAAALNRSIVQAAPSDVDAWNRLGKALLELGRFREAFETYGRSLELDPVNQIAKRNLDRLEGLKDQEVSRGPSIARVAQDLFIEEVGKTGVTVLQIASIDLMPTLTSGDEVYLKPLDDAISVESADGDYLGQLEPKLGLRLLRLIDGGSQYAAAVKSLNDQEVELIIKETFRHPSQTRPSFQPSSSESVRPYIRESLLRLGDDDDEELLDDDIDRGDDEPDIDSGDSSGFGFGDSGDSEDEDEDA